MLKVSISLAHQGFKQQALAVSTDPEHRFELALQLGELKIAYQLAVEAEVRTQKHTQTLYQRLDHNCNLMSQWIRFSVQYISDMFYSVLYSQSRSGSS